VHYPSGASSQSFDRQCTNVRHCQHLTRVLPAAHWPLKVCRVKTSGEQGSDRQLAASSCSHRAVYARSSRSRCRRHPNQGSHLQMSLPGTSRHSVALRNLVAVGGIADSGRPSARQIYGFAPGAAKRLRCPIAAGRHGTRRILSGSGIRLTCKHWSVMSAFRRKTENMCS